MKTDSDRAARGVSLPREWDRGLHLEGDSFLLFFALSAMQLISWFFFLRNWSYFVRSYFLYYFRAKTRLSAFTTTSYFWGGGLFVCPVIPLLPVFGLDCLCVRIRKEAGRLHSLSTFFLIHLQRILPLIFCLLLLKILIEKIAIAAAWNESES